MALPYAALFDPSQYFLVYTYDSPYSLTSPHSPPVVIHREEYNKGKDAVPETRGVSEGSAKRIITRKHNPYDKADKKNHGGGGGKGNWDDLDDGSMDVYDEVAAPTDVSP